MHMQEFDRKRLRSIESELQDLKDDTSTVDSKSTLVYKFTVYFCIYNIYIYIYIYNIYIYIYIKSMYTVHTLYTLSRYWRTISKVLYIKSYSVNHEFFFEFRFETGWVLSIQKPSGIWTHIATMQNLWVQIPDGFWILNTRPVSKRNTKKNSWFTL